ncbi:alpha/beta hydrolase [Oricola sp.]|uniref:alpha/beta fold hydrolase n=1 Tax=Oricola sp. TaxID=1979950 RepID=UPI0025F66B65|nr:alpha/beta hydrolase [Oricola sp.]MCI5074582.1 alpha/beta hydrolase [Oricola sp.]
MNAAATIQTQPCSATLRPQSAHIPALAAGSTVPDLRIGPATMRQPDTVFLHGVLSSPNMWKGLSRPDDPLNAVALPLPGHFPWALPPQDVANLLTDFKFLHAYRNRIRELTDRRVRLVAHSTGALAALKMAALWPDLIDRVVLFGALGCGRKAATRSMMANAVTMPWIGRSLFRLLYDLWLHSPNLYAMGVATAKARQDRREPLPIHEQTILRDLRRSDPESLRAVVRWLQTTSVTDDLPGIEVAVTVVIGARDPVVEADEQLRLARAIPSATAVICDAGHLPMFEAPRIVRNMLG